MENEHLCKRLWRKGIALVEDGCLIRDEEDEKGEPCGLEPVIGVWIDDDGDAVTVGRGDPRPVVFCAKHHGWPSIYDARGLSPAVDWQGHKVATVCDGLPSPPRINPAPAPSRTASRDRE